MSFLFKSKSSKNAPAQPPPQGLPSANRNIHTSDGASNAVKPPSTAQPDARKAQSPPPNAGANGSLNSLTETKPAPIPHQQIAPATATAVSGTAPAAQAPFARRDRAGSELGVSSKKILLQYPLNLLAGSFSTANATTTCRSLSLVAETIGLSKPASKSLSSIRCRCQLHCF